MNRKARIFMYFSFAFINFFFFRGVGIHALGLVFLVLGIMQLMAKPKRGLAKRWDADQEDLAQTFE